MRTGPLSFDPVLVGNRETDAWAGYYRHEWRTFLVAAVGMVAAGFGMAPHRTLTGAWYVLRANQAWAPYPDNQPDAARAYMRRFYELVDLPLDPAKAAMLEVEWWRVHRDHQHDEASAKSSSSRRSSTCTRTCTASSGTRYARQPSGGSRRWTCRTGGSGQAAIATTRCWRRSGALSSRRTPPCALRWSRSDCQLARPPVIGRPRCATPGPPYG
ncbi:MAG TPA: hypothetical protein VGL05_37825 [Kribbella sp.]